MLKLYYVTLSLKQTHAQKYHDDLRTMVTSCAPKDVFPANFSCHPARPSLDSSCSILQYRGGGAGWLVCHLLWAHSALLPWAKLTHAALRCRQPHPSGPWAQALAPAPIRPNLCSRWRPDWFPPLKWWPKWFFRRPPNGSLSRSRLAISWGNQYR